MHGCYDLHASNYACAWLKNLVLVPFILYSEYVYFGFYAFVLFCVRFVNLFLFLIPFSLYDPCVRSCLRTVHAQEMRTYNNVRLLRKVPTTNILRMCSLQTNCYVH